MLCKWLSPLANQLIDRRHLAQFPLGSKNKGVIYQKMQLDARAQFSRKNHPRICRGMRGPAKTVDTSGGMTKRGP